MPTLVWQHKVFGSEKKHIVLTLFRLIVAAASVPTQCISHCATIKLIISFFTN